MMAISTVFTTACQNAAFWTMLVKLSKPTNGLSMKPRNGRYCSKAITFPSSGT